MARNQSEVLAMPGEPDHDPETGEIREAAGANIGEYSVSEIAHALKRTLERMGDLASNIAARVEELLNYPPIVLPAEFRTMVSTVRRMVRDALDALINSDVAVARRVLTADDTVDQIHRQMFREMKALAQKDPENMEAPISVLSVSRYLERIADQCTNIAEDVVFLVEGDIVRHRRRR